MFYLQLVAPAPREQRPMPRDIVQGPFASANEAQGYWTKLNMWFPEAMQEAQYQITDRSALVDATADHIPGR